MSEELLSPFHSGEQAVQRRYGVHEKLAKRGRKVIRPFMPDQHRIFYGQLPFILAGSSDELDRPWASILFGDPGFVESPDEVSLMIRAKPHPGDPLATNLNVGSSLGMLGIELHTRRRNRVNGKVVSLTDGIQFHVDQAFGNCPKYIQTRAYEKKSNHAQGQVSIERLTEFDIGTRALIGNSDTFFIASANLTHGDRSIDSTAFGLDISHRGGASGFVEVLDNRRFRFPDYRGNYHFNTVGNLIENPRSGYLFLDFVNGNLLQLTGQTTVLWNGDSNSFEPGSETMLVFELEEMVRHKGRMPLKWHLF